MSLALVCAVALLLAPATAEGAPRRAVPTVSVSPAVGTQDTRFVGSGQGFTPSSTVTVRVTQPDGQEYAGSYTRSRAADASGAISWTWVWDPGDQLGTYTFLATDVSGTSAQVSFTINASGGPPPAEAGSTLMFDAASAPPLSTMQAWLASPYRTVGVYVPVAPGTDDRHDKQQVNLTADWVAQVRGLGWSVLPIYLGVQAPDACQQRNFWHMSADLVAARQQGSEAAAYAAASVQGLGIPTSVPVVYDMEPYASGCSAAVAAFFDGWTVGLHQAGRLSGVYGTAASAMKDLSAHLGDASFHEPDVVWVATDNRNPGTGGLTYPPDGSFVGHRANQFRLGVVRSYGGVNLTVDESAINDPVLAGVPPTAQPPAPVPPRVKAARLAPYTLAPDVTARWTGAAGAPGQSLTYDVRTRTGTWRTRPGTWHRPATLQGVAGRSAHVRVADGRTWCFSVRAHASDGTTSAWSPPSCTTRPVDDRALRGRGWSRVRSARAFDHTAATTTSNGASLTLGRVRAARVGVLLAGGSRGTLRIELDGRLIGRVAARTGRSTRLVWLPGAKLRHGRLVLISTSRKRVVVDGVVLASG